MKSIKKLLEERNPYSGGRPEAVRLNRNREREKGNIVLETDIPDKLYIMHYHPRTKLVPGLFSYPGNIHGSGGYLEGYVLHRRYFNVKGIQLAIGMRSLKKFLAWMKPFYTECEEIALKKRKKEEKKRTAAVKKQVEQVLGLKHRVINEFFEAHNDIYFVSTESVADPLGEKNQQGIIVQALYEAEIGRAHV